MFDHYFDILFSMILNICFDDTLFTILYFRTNYFNYWNNWLPTQSTCLYYDHDNEASKCVLLCRLFFSLCADPSNIWLLSLTEQPDVSVGILRHHCCCASRSVNTHFISAIHRDILYQPFQLKSITKFPKNYNKHKNQKNLQQWKGKTIDKIYWIINMRKVYPNNCNNYH